MPSRRGRRGGGAKTGRVTSFAPLNVPRVWPVAASLPDGRVIVAGDSGSVDVYEPSDNSFHVVPNVLPDGLMTPEVLVLRDGRVLLAGGSFQGPYRPMVDSYLIDVRRRVVSRVGPLPWPLNDGADGRVLPDGRALLTASPPGEQYDLPDTKRECQIIFDPAVRTWTDTKTCRPTTAAVQRDPEGIFADPLTSEVLVCKK